MPDLPTGTVTFLFTDIEGSTTLLVQHPAAMRQALVRHDVLREQIVAENHGHVVRPRGEGDSRFAGFARASDAVEAAAMLQQAFYAEPWPTPTPLRVRMALHTGEADLREGDYYGSAVNRCAQLRAAARGGQTLVSQATYELVRDTLPPASDLGDLGQHTPALPDALAAGMRQREAHRGIVYGTQRMAPGADGSSTKRVGPAALCSACHWARYLCRWVAAIVAMR